MANPDISAVFGADWQQRLAQSPNGRLEAGGLVLVPNTDAAVDAQTGAVTGNNTPQSFTVFNGADGGKTNWLFDKGGNFQNTYAGNNPFTWKDIAQSAAMVGLGMVGGGALSGLTSGVGALGGIAGVGSDVAGAFGLGGSGAAPSIATSSFEAPTAVGGWSSAAAPGALGSGTFGLEVPGMANVATGGALGSGTYGIPGMTTGAAGAGLPAAGGWLGATGSALGSLGGSAGLEAAAPGFLESLGLGNINMGSLIGPAASLIGGAMGSNAAGKASDAQLQAAREAAALNEPFRQAGMQGMNRLTDLLGVSGRTGAEGYGSAAKDFSMADYQADPGYQFRQQQGEQAIQRAASAAGRSDSGRAYKDLMSFNSGLASQEYGNAYNRYQTNRASKINPLQSLMGAGQTAANTIGDLRTQAGNAQAAGTVGSANAWTNGLSGAIGSYQQNELLNMLKNRSSMYGS